MIEKNIRGEDFASQMPDLISTAYRGTLADQILRMPRQNPISFEAAVALMTEAYNQATKARQIGYERGLSGWYVTNFVRWISEKGWHIELTGDEFELFSMMDSRSETASPQD